MKIICIHCESDDMSYDDCSSIDYYHGTLTLIFNCSDCNKETEVKCQAVTIDKPF